MARLQALKPRLQPLGAKRQARGWAATSTEGTTARGYGWAWQQIRERILDRDCGLCQPCKAAGRITMARAVDHKVSKANGGSDDDSNLQAICDPCHKAKTAAERSGG